MSSAVAVAGLALLAGSTHMPFVWVAIAVLVGAALFSVFQTRIGTKLIGGARLRSIVPPGSIACIVICLGGTLLSHPLVGALIGTPVYVISNWGRIRELWQLCRPHIIGLVGKRKATIALVR
jgi:hypothetical protein